MVVSGGFGGGALPFSDSPLMMVLALLVLGLVAWLVVRVVEF